jgi:hypothetical protein
MQLEHHSRTSTTLIVPLRRANDSPFHDKMRQDVWSQSAARAAITHPHTCLTHTFIQSEERPGPPFPWRGSASSRCGHKFIHPPAHFPSMPLHPMSMRATGVPLFLFPQSLNHGFFCSNSLGAAPSSPNPWGAGKGGIAGGLGLWDCYAR